MLSICFVLLFRLLHTQEVSKLNLYDNSLGRCITHIDDMIVVAPSAGSSNTMRLFSDSTAASEYSPGHVMPDYCIVLRKMNDYRAGFLAVLRNGELIRYTIENRLPQILLRFSTAFGPNIVDAIPMIYTDYVGVISGAELHLFDISKLTPVASPTYTKLSGTAFTVLTFIDYTTYIIAGVDSGTIEIRDYTSPTFIPQEVTITPTVPVSSLCTVWNRELIVVGMKTGGLHFLETRTPNTIIETKPGHTSAVSSLMWFNMTGYVASGDVDGLIIIWDVYSKPTITSIVTITSLQSAGSIALNMITRFKNSLKYIVGTDVSGKAAYYTFATSNMQCYSSCSGGCSDFSEYGCSACKSGFSLESTGFCTKLCPDGDYLFRNNNTCVTCHSDCISCTGASAQQCKLCSGGKLISTDQRKCTSTCPADAFQINSTHCDVCFPSCATCRAGSKNDCTTCPAGKLLDLASDCVTRCAPGGFKLDAISCAPCHPKCKTCIDGSESGCLDCQNPEYNYMNDLNTCIDCSQRWMEAGDICNMTRNVTMLQKSAWNYDMYSSISMEVVIKNRSMFRKVFEEIDWNEMFDVRFAHAGRGRGPGAQSRLRVQDRVPAERNHRRPELHLRQARLLEDDCDPQKVLGQVRLQREPV